MQQYDQERFRHLNVELQKMEERNRELQRGRDQLLVQLHDLRFQVGVRVGGQAGGQAGGVGGWFWRSSGNPLGGAVWGEVQLFTRLLAMQHPMLICACTFPLPACLQLEQAGHLRRQLPAADERIRCVGACRSLHLHLHSGSQPPANLLRPLIGRSD